TGRLPRWPTGGDAMFDLAADDRDRNWTTGLPPHAPPGEMKRLQELLSPQYSTAVGIVRLPATAVSTGGEWSFEEHEAGADGRRLTRYAYRLLARDGKRIHVAVAQSTRRDDGARTAATVQTVRGEVEYALDQPLPVGGWLEKIWPDGRV